MDGLTTVPGVVSGHIEDVTAKGGPVVRLPDGTTYAAEPVWGMNDVIWADCIGCRVLIARDSSSDEVYALALLDAPPNRPTDVPDELKVESGKELVIACGKAKIALRADGRIEIRGGHLVSRSSGANKIRGASVTIN